MKKLLTVLLSVLMLASLTACAGNAKPKTLADDISFNITIISFVQNNKICESFKIGLDLLKKGGKI